MPGQRRRRGPEGVAAALHRSRIGGLPRNQQLRSADGWVVSSVEGRERGSQGSLQMDGRRGDYCRSVGVGIAKTSKEEGRMSA